MRFVFTPEIKTVGTIGLKCSEFDIKNEVMIFSGDYKFTRQHCGPLTHMVLDNIVQKVIDHFGFNITNNIVIDTRVNMLMKGQYPSIPGWHCDDVPRNTVTGLTTKVGQPNLFLVDPSVQHFMVLLSTGSTAHGVSGTEFVTSDREYKIDPDNVWNSLNISVNNDSDKRTLKVVAGEVIRFNQLSIHRASPATENGWRYFFRLSVTHRVPRNEIRNQVQIYVDLNDSGW